MRAPICADADLCTPRMGDIGRGRSGSAAWEGFGCTLSLFACGFLGAHLRHRKAMSVHFLGAKLRWDFGELLYDLCTLPFSFITNIDLSPRKQNKCEKYFVSLLRKEFGCSV